MLIDEAHITIKAGDGGNGLVHFYHDLHRPKGGPDGGNGGDGGSVFFEAVSDISKLHQFRHQKNFAAVNGAGGGPNQKTGKNGQDLVLQIPVGTIVSYDNGTRVEFLQKGQRVMMAKGGQGGLGNYHFRSATDQTPVRHTLGQKRPPRKLFLELKLIADIGLIGLPNAGKSSLLNELTNTHAKVANYPFTTLEPNLGVAKGNIIIADIPGLIEGASSGKGLGLKFLKHIERTRLLVHCLSAESADLAADYQAVRREIESYSSRLSQTPEIVVITKSDLHEGKKPKLSLKHDLAVSILDDQSIKQLHDLISQKLG